MVLRDDAGEVIAEIAEGIGSATNNVAEYTALIRGLELALDRGVTEIDVRLDSQLVVSQVLGEWKIKNERLRNLAARAQMLLGRFRSSSVGHVRRAQNSHADELANRGMDEMEHDVRDEPDQGSLL